MRCDCHGEPAYWQKDNRLKAGGWWECAVKRRQRQRDLYESDEENRRRILRRMRDRYDADPVYRIEKLMKHAARRRRQTIQ